MSVPNTGHLEVVAGKHQLTRCQSCSDLPSSETAAQSTDGGTKHVFELEKEGLSTSNSRGLEGAVKTKLTWHGQNQHIGSKKGTRSCKSN